MLIDQDGPGLVLPILVPWWLPKLSRVGAGEVGDNTMHVGRGHSTWAEAAGGSSSSASQLAGLCSCPRGPEISSDAKAGGKLPFLGPQSRSLPFHLECTKQGFVLSLLSPISQALPNSQKW